MKHKHKWKKISEALGCSWCSMCGVLRYKQWDNKRSIGYYSYTKPKILKWYGRDIERQLSTLRKRNRL